MVWVRPGVLLVLAILLPTSELIRLDLPTLERPRNAISGAPAGGNCSGAAAEVTKRVNTFMQAIPPSWTQGARSEKGTRTPPSVGLFTSKWWSAVRLLVCRCRLRVRRQRRDSGRVLVRHFRQRTLQRIRQHIIHGIDEAQLHYVAQVFRHVGQVLFIIGRKQDFHDSGTVSRQQLLFQPADGQYLAAQRDL